MIELGGGKSLFDLETNLIINDLVERAALVYKSVELDDVRVLIFCTSAWENNAGG